MVYKYSVFIILRNGFIDNQNSFLNKELSIFNLFRENLLFENEDVELKKLFVEFEKNKDLKSGIWLDFGDYNLPQNVEKIYIYKDKENLQN